MCARTADASVRGRGQATAGRIDEAVIHEEFGSWRESGGGHFVVVGTRPMEHTAWQWVQATVGKSEARALLSGGGGWRSLRREPPGVCPQPPGTSA